MDFPRQHTVHTIHLVGDIVDVWRLKKPWLRRQSHNDLVQKLLRMGRKGK